MNNPPTSSKVAVPLDAVEQKCVKTILIIPAGGLIAVLIIFVIMEVVAYENGVRGFSLWFLVPIFVLAFAYCLAAYPFRYVPSDKKNGVKAVEDTDLLRVQMLGFFETTLGGISSALFGSVYYLWLADATRKSGHRKFRINLATYKHFRDTGEKRIKISYLPKSGIVLGIDSATLHYRPYDENAEWVRKLREQDHVNTL